MALFLDYPLNVRTPFGAEGLERMARAAGFGPQSRLLQVGAGEGGLHLAARIGCHVQVVDESADLLEQMSEQVAARGLSSKVDLGALKMAGVPVQSLPLPESSFDGVFTELRLAWRYAEALGGLRRFLVPNGRLTLCYPVVLSSDASEASVLWKKRLGQALPTPMVFLETLTRSGFESLTGEVLSPLELRAFYERVDDEESRAARVSEGHFSWMQVLGRRREPGEKPPASRRGDR